MQSTCLLLFVSFATACGRTTSGHSVSDGPVGHTGGTADETPGSGGGGAGGGRTVDNQPPSEAPLQPSADCRLPKIAPNCSGEFCRIEAGCFIMGAPPGEWAQGRYSTTQVQVTLSRAFEMGKTEVTRKAWEEAGFVQPAQHAQYGAADCLEPDCPQGNITFFDTISFANRVSELKGLSPCYLLSECTGSVGDGLSCRSVRTSAPSVHECSGYRLPTEAEWEYAARAGVKTAFFSGSITQQPDLDCYDDPNLDPIAWYCFNSGKQAHPVARKAANAWGLYDTSGNVYEWCNDIYKPRGYGTGPLRDPGGMLGESSELTLVPPEQRRVTRGGDYLMPAYSSKNNWHTDFADATFGANVGARLARTLPASE